MALPRRSCGCTPYTGVNLHRDLLQLDAQGYVAHAMGAAALACKTGGVIDPPKRRGEQQALPVPTVAMLPRSSHDNDSLPRLGQEHLCVVSDKAMKSLQSSQQFAGGAMVVDQRLWPADYMMDLSVHGHSTAASYESTGVAMRRESGYMEAKIAKAASCHTFRHAWTSCDPSWRRPGGAHGEESRPASAAPPERGRLPRSQAGGAIAQQLPMGRYSQPASRACWVSRFV